MLVINWNQAVGININWLINLLHGENNPLIWHDPHPPPSILESSHIITFLSDSVPEALHRRLLSFRQCHRLSFYKWIQITVRRGLSTFFSSINVQICFCYSHDLWIRNVRSRNKKGEGLINQFMFIYCNNSQDFLSKRGLKWWIWLGWKSL